MNSDLTIAVIGAGHLGSSIIEKLFKTGHKSLIATRRNQAELVNLKGRFPGLKVMTSNQEAASLADVVILTMKEYSFRDLAKELTDSLAGKLVISLGPTLSFEKLSEIFGAQNGIKFARVMTPVYPHEDLVCYSLDAVCGVGEEEIVRSIFSNHGKNIERVDEVMLPIVTTYVVFRGVLNSLLEPLYQKSVEAGLNPELAEKILGQMLVSCGKDFEQGIKAEERLESGSGGFNEKSFTLQLHKKLDPARKLLGELFEQFYLDLKK